VEWSPTIQFALDPMPEAPNSVSRPRSRSAPLCDEIAFRDDRCAAGFDRQPGLLLESGPFVERATERINESVPSSASPNWNIDHFAGTEDSVASLDIGSLQS